MCRPAVTVLDDWVERRRWQGTNHPIGAPTAQVQPPDARSQPVGVPCVSLVILEPLCPVDHKPREI